MKFFSLLILALLSVVLCKEATYSFFSVNIDKIGSQKLQELKSFFKTEPSFTIELDSKLLIHSKHVDFVKKVSKLPAIEYELLRSNVVSPRISILNHVHYSEFLTLENVDVLLSGSGYAVLNSKSEKMASALSKKENFVPFESNMILVRQSENENLVFSEKVNDKVKKMVSKVKEDRWFKKVEELCKFNRYSYNEQIIKAQEYVIEKLKKIGKFNVTIENYLRGSTKVWNILAELKGTEKPDDIYIVAGHIDSTSNSPSTAAPGAVDDASGSASVLEIAKIFAKYPPKHTMHFMWYSFEEQGLIGSTYSAEALVKRGDKEKVKLMLQHDMTGFKVASNPLKVLIETDRKYESIVKVFQESAQKYCDGLQTAVSYRPFGSDHVPYIRRGMPGFLTIDNDYSRYPHYHRTTDLPQYVVKKMGFEIIKMNVAVLATLMGYE